ncbi:MAG: carbonic anhydrase [Phycisphaerales bacterium]
MRSTVRQFVFLVAVGGASVAALAQNEQSPIDIRNENISYNAALPSLNFSYSQNTPLDVVNTGSPDEEATVKANVPAGAGSVSVSGNTYDLLQFHFHTPAEHWLNGHESEMELHMVHRDAGGNLMVVGRWIEEGPANAALDSIFSNLPTSTADPRSIASFDLTSMLTADLYSFRYHGSLTTPPYTEGVNWVLLTQPLTMSHAQIEAFRTLFPHDNSRLPQALNGRIVETDDPAYIPAPGAAAALALGGLFASRRRR